MPDAHGVKRALILFGAPGSGKGTQAKLLKESLNIPHISTGDMLRERIQSGDELGIRVKRLIDAGELVTDEMVNQMVDDRIARPDCANGFILDGYPRTLGQAGAIVKRLAERGMGWTVIHLKVDYNVIVGRLSGRRSCAGCAAVYNVITNPPRIPDTCDACESRLTIRDDDKEAVVRRRLEAYEVQTSPLLEFFAGEGKSFHEVEDLNMAPPVIAGRIRELMAVR